MVNFMSTSRILQDKCILNTNNDRTTTDSVFIVMIIDLPNFRHIASLVSHLYSASFFSMSFTAVGMKEKHVHHNITLKI